MARTTRRTRVVGLLVMAMQALVLVVLLVIPMLAKMLLFCLSPSIAAPFSAIVGCCCRIVSFAGTGSNVQTASKLWQPIQSLLQP